MNQASPNKFEIHFVGDFKKISLLSEQFPVILLFLLGTILILMAFLFRVQTDRGIFWRLAPDEFKAVIAAATLLLAFASLIKLYQYKGWREIIREQQKMGVDLIKQKERAMANKK